MGGLPLENIGGLRPWGELPDRACPFSLHTVATGSEEVVYQVLLGLRLPWQSERFVRLLYGPSAYGSLVSVVLSFATQHPMEVEITV